jgi:hypothetical protein
VVFLSLTSPLCLGAGIGMLNINFSIVKIFFISVGSKDVSLDEFEDFFRDLAQ